MKITLLWIGLAGSAAWAQSRMPAWLADYPGATAQTRRSAVLVETAYEVAAKPGEVIGHYRKLFEGVGLAWQPNLDGVGTVIRGAAAECDLLLKIREQGTGTSVRVSCAARVLAPMMQAAPAPTAPVIPAARQSADERRREISRKSLEGMEKYDRPYNPPSRPPAPRLVWPAWLVSVDGAPLAAEKGVDQFKLNYLKSAYLTNADRNGAVAFYTELLNANGYRVYMHTPPTWPRDRKAWVDADLYSGANPGPRIVIHLDFTPDEQGMRVDMRMTAHQ